VALVNNTGVLFELLGLFVFAIILALFHNNQGVGVVFDTGGADFTAGNFLVAMFMGLFVIYGFDTASTLAEETNDPRRAAPRAVLGSIAARSYRLRLPVGDADGDPGRPRQGRRRRRHLAADIINANLSNALGHRLPVRRLVRDLRLLPGDPGVDDPARLRHGARQAAPGSSVLQTVNEKHRDAGRRVHPDRADGGAVPAQVRRRRVHRDRGLRDDLPVLHPREHRDPAARGNAAGRRPRASSRSGAGGCWSTSSRSGGAARC
jgi:hypothetical protein